MMNGSRHERIMFLCFSLAVQRHPTKECNVFYPKTMQQNLLIQSMQQKYVCWPRLLIIRFGIEVQLEPKIVLWLVRQSHIDYRFRSKEISILAVSGAARNFSIDAWIRIDLQENQIHANTLEDFDNLANISDIVDDYIDPKQI